MAKLTTLEGDFDFYGCAGKPRKSPLQSNEVMLGWTLKSAARGAVSAVKTATKVAVQAPVSVVRAVQNAPVTVAKLVGAPKAVVDIAKAAVYVPNKILDGVSTAKRVAVNTVFKVPEVVAPKIATVVSKGVGVVQRNPVAFAPITGGASLALAAGTKRGREALTGRPSAIQQVAHFAERHPYMTAAATGGVSLIAAGSTKRGRQALANKKPGFRTATGLEGAEAKAYLDLKNKGKLSVAEQKKLDELEAKGKRNDAMQKFNAAEKVKAEEKKKAEAEKAESDAKALSERQAQAAASGITTGGGGSSGGGSYSEQGQAPTGESSSMLGPALMAAGLGALLLL